MNIREKTSLPGAQILPGVQVLRGVAACSVLVHHVLEESQPLFHGHLPEQLVRLGASGVDLFFVISGFIMVYTNQGSFGRSGASADFFFRRILRIGPLYWLCTFAVVAASCAGLYASKEISPLSLALSLLFLPNSNIVLGVGWTLNYEMYFYGIFSVWLLLGSQRAGVIGILASIPLIMVLAWWLPPGQVRDFLGNPIVLEFCFGCALALACKRRKVSSQVALAVFVAAASGLALGTWFGPGDGTAGLASKVRFLFWGLPAAGLLLSALSVRRVKRRAGRVLLLMGDASYSIYLTHAFVMTAYAKVLKHHPLPLDARTLLILAPILLSLLIGLATFYVIERPIRRLVRPSRVTEGSDGRPVVIPSAG